MWQTNGILIWYIIFFSGHVAFKTYIVWLPRGGDTVVTIATHLRAVLMLLYRNYAQLPGAYLLPLHHMGQVITWPIANLVFILGHHGYHSNTLKWFSDSLISNHFMAFFGFLTHGVKFCYFLDFGFFHISGTFVPSMRKLDEELFSFSIISKLNSIQRKWCITLIAQVSISVKKMVICQHQYSPKWTLWQNGCFSLGK